jgi:adenosine deaminase
MKSLTALPKAEIHIHLEGCFEKEDCVRYAGEAGIPLRKPVDRLFEVDSFDGFMGMLDWVCGLVRTREQLFETAYKFSQRQMRSGILYSDVIINPTHWAAWRRDVPGMIDAIDAGFAAAEQDGYPPARLAVSLMRTQTREESLELVDLLIALKHPRVAAFSVDGNEMASPGSFQRFSDAFARAAKAGLNRTVHAGESGGPDGVRDALLYLNPDRIDHGVRAIEDPDVVEMLLERNVPLGICPISNLIILYKKIEEHPIDELRRLGIPVSVNTDDPGLIGCTMEESYQLCIDTFGWDESVVRSVAATSIEASYADPDLKADLRAKLAAW